jgi:putative FmdB family regulatory protein
MPMYEYQCQQCGHVFETIQRFSDAPLTVHEGCGGAVVRLISAPALVFKGSGFYITDYAKGSGGGTGKPAEKGKKSDSSSSGTESKSSDSGSTSTPSTSTSSTDSSKK